MKTWFFQILLIFSTINSHCLAADGAKESKVEVRSIAGDEEYGSFANSILIEGKNSIILVDAQRTLLNAKKVIQEIQATGKSLTNVFITHAHPDHFLGAAAIHEAFPKATFIATSGVVKALQRDAEKMRASISKTLKEQKASDEIPASVIIPNVVESKIPFDDTLIEVLETSPGESEAAGFLSLPQIRTIIAGDIVYNHVHLWLHDGRFKEWKQNLKNLKAVKGVETIFPGHGLSTKVSVLNENLRYIDDFEATLKSSNSPAVAIEKMQQIYPDFKMKRFLTFGVETLFVKK